MDKNILEACGVLVQKRDETLHVELPLYPFGEPHKVIFDVEKVGSEYLAQDRFYLANVVRGFGFSTDDLIDACSYTSEVECRDGQLKVRGKTLREAVAKMAMIMDRVGMLIGQTKGERLKL